MKNISLIITILFIHSLNIIIAQSPTIEWQHTFVGSEAEVLYSIQQTNDGGYILGGHSASERSGDKTEASQG